MNNDQSQAQNYRPRSPNLSGFQAPPPPKLNRLPSIPNSADSGFPQISSFQHRGSYDAAPHYSQSPSSARPPQSNYFATQIQQSPFASQPPQHHFGDYNPFQPAQLDDMARLRNRPQVNYSDDAYPTNEFEERVAISQQRLPPQPQPIVTGFPPQSMYPQAFSQPQPLAPMPIPVPVQSQPPPLSHSSLLPDIEVKTKFPVARIKRIMQTDEDIGKVAQATPTAVAKALELFMIALVSKGASNAKDQGSKRVTATHLKNALLADPQFDFLNEICESVPDESVKKSRAKSEAKSESDDEDIAGATASKKRKGGRKKKAAGDDSD